MTSTVALSWGNQMPDVLQQYDDLMGPKRPPPTPSARRAGRLAVQGLVLVILGLVPVVGVVLALVGAVLCILALSSTAAQTGTRRWAAIIGLVAAPLTLIGGVAILVLLVTDGGNVPTWRRGPRPYRPYPGLAPRTVSQQQAQQQREAEAAITHNGLQCMANLSNIGAAIRQFELDHGRMPTALSELYPQYLPSLETFVCPGAKELVVTPEEIDSKGSYAYDPPARGADPATAWLVYDRSVEHHGSSGRYVLYVNGRVAWSAGGRRRGRR